MRKVLLFVVFVSSAVSLFAQQDPQFSQNMYIKLPVNPGYAGTEGSICGTLVYRNQWVGFPGTPTTTLFTIDAPIPILRGGAGLTVVNDKLGNFNFMHARGAYSYHISTNRGLVKLGVGLEVGIMQASVQHAWLTPSGNDGGPDVAIPNAAVKDLTYDVGLGIYYKLPKFYAGISTSHLPGSAQKLQATEFDYHVARHYYILTGYDLQLGESKFMLRPSVHVKTDTKITTFDANVNLLYDSKFWLGVSYRLKDAVVPHLGFAIPLTSTSGLKIGYAYDLGVSGLKSAHNNTHEVLLNYCIKFTPPVHVSTHRNPRFMGN